MINHPSPDHLSVAVFLQGPWIPSNDKSWQTGVGFCDIKHRAAWTETVHLMSPTKSRRLLKFKTICHIKLKNQMKNIKMYKKKYIYK